GVGVGGGTVGYAAERWDTRVGDVIVGDRCDGRVVEIGGLIHRAVILPFGVANQVVDIGLAQRLLATDGEYLRFHGLILIVQLLLERYVRIGEAAIGIRYHIAGEI